MSKDDCWNGSKWLNIVWLIDMFLGYSVCFCSINVYCTSVSVERSTRSWTLAAAPCWGLKTWRIRVRCWPQCLCWNCWRTRRTEKSATCSRVKACENTVLSHYLRDYSTCLLCALMALWMFTEAINCAGYTLWLQTAVRDSSQPALTSQVHHIYVCLGAMPWALF